MQEVLALLLRKGVIPICSTGAAFCFGLYSAKLSHAADLWDASIVDDTFRSTPGNPGEHEFENGGNGSLVGDDEFTRQQPITSNTTTNTATDPNLEALRYHRESVKVHAEQLKQHSGTCLCLSLISGAIAREGYMDWQYYAVSRSTATEPDWQELAVKLWKRQRPFPFFARPPVLVVASLSLAMSHKLYGDWRMWRPEQPMYYAS